MRVLLVEFSEQGVERGVRLSTSETSVSSETAFDPASRIVRKVNTFLFFSNRKTFSVVVYFFCWICPFCTSFSHSSWYSSPCLWWLVPNVCQEGQKSRKKEKKRRGSQERGNQIVCVVCARSVPRVAYLVVERQRTSALLYPPPAMTSVTQS